MAFYVRLYSLDKRDNSTKRPTGDGNLQRCILRRGSSLMTPVLEFDFGTDTDSNPIEYNYCYIPQFERYFFIEDWTFSGALWIASCVCDVLATYKNEIGAASLYILRASAASDGSITDTLYPAKTGCTFDTATAATPWTLSGGTFCVGIVDGDADFGSLSYVILAPGVMPRFMGALMSDSWLQQNGFDSSDFSYALQKSLVNPIQYVASAVYLPFTASGGASKTLRPGGFTVGTLMGGSALSPGGTTYTITRTLSIPKHPQAASRGVYLNQAPYSIYTLTVPPFGCIDLDSTVLRNASSVTCEVSVDLPTGLGILTVTCNGIVLNRLEANVGVPVQLSQVSRDYVGAVTSALSGVASIAGGIGGGIATGGAMGVVTGGSGVASGLSSIGDAVKAIQPRVQSVGSGGSYAQLEKAWRLDAQFFPMVDDDNAHNGRPYCKMATPASLGGYMLVQDADVAIAGTSTEDSRIREYLQTGFYYE